MKSFLTLFVSALFLLSSCQSAPPSASVATASAPEASASVPPNSLNSSFYSEGHLDFPKWKRDNTCCTARGRKSAIASGGSHASRIGIEVMARGGNLIDAAVATAFALAVERPFSCGIGGGGFLLFRAHKGATYFYDFRETAPLKATRDMYLDARGEVIPDKSTDGGAAVAVPGLVRGLYDVHKAHGSMPWEKIVQPAAELAAKGFKVYPSFANALQHNVEKLAADAYLKKLFQNDKGEWLKEGDDFVQKDLAATLHSIAKQGPKAFHQGAVARAIVKAANDRGGVLQLKDLSEYRTAKRRPIRGVWQGYEVVSAPPPSAGGTLMMAMLNTLAPMDLSTGRPLVDNVDRLARVMKAAYLERGVFGDSDFVGKAYQALLRGEFAAKVRATIVGKGETPANKPLPPDDHGTAHLSGIDGLGNAVASTITINTSFGSGVGVPGTGIILNNEMDDFSSKPGLPNAYGLIGSENNSIQPRKRPVSTMTPTILAKDNLPVLAVGGAGGSRILSSVFQVIYHSTVTYPQDVRRALFTPRLHHQGKPDRLDLEDGFPESVKSALREKGYKVAPFAWHAQVEAVGRGADGDFIAVFDPRDEGGASAR